MAVGRGKQSRFPNKWFVLSTWWLGSLTYMMYLYVMSCLCISDDRQADSPMRLYLSLGISQSLQPVLIEPLQLQSNTNYSKSTPCSLTRLFRDPTRMGFPACPFTGSCCPELIYNPGISTVLPRYRKEHCYGYPQDVVAELNWRKHLLHKNPGRKFTFFFLSRQKDHW